VFVEFIEFVGFVEFKSVNLRNTSEAVNTVRYREGDLN
jgi:hypothetical protein